MARPDTHWFVAYEVQLDGQTTFWSNRRVMNEEAVRRGWLFSSATARSILTVVVVSGFLGTSVLQADGIPGLAIREVRICQDVEDHQPVKILNDPSHLIKNRPVWVWLLLTGTSESLSHLKSGQKLPIRTVFLRIGEAPTEYAEDASTEDTQPTTISELLAKFHSADAKTLPLGTISKFPALKSEVEEEGGVWGWRTASEKIHLLVGNYRVYFFLTSGGNLKLPNGADFLRFRYEP